MSAYKVRIPKQDQEYGKDGVCDKGAYLKLDIICEDNFLLIVNLLRRFRSGN